MSDDTVLRTGIGNCLLDQKSESTLRYDGMCGRLSHLPDGSGRLLKSGLGGSLGAGIDGEYLASSGSGGKKEGLLTITGV